jgi:hypothetical protein
MENLVTFHNSIMVPPGGWSLVDNKRNTHIATEFWEAVRYLPHFSRLLTHNDFGRAADSRFAAVSN